MKEPVNAGSFFIPMSVVRSGYSLIAVTGFSRYLNHILLAFDGGVSPL